jgi:predicted deacetylase
VIGHALTRFDWIEGPLMSFVTGLRTTLSAARLAWLPRGHTRRITRWWLRTVVRRALRLFPKLLMCGTQVADFLFQRGHTLQ